MSRSAGLLDFVEAGLPTDLTSGAPFHRARSILDGYSLDGGGGFELRASPPRLDAVSVRVPLPPRPGSSTPSLPDIPDLDDRVEAVWLEYDVGGDSPAVPAVFIGLTREGAGVPALAPHRRRILEDAVDFVAEVHDAWFGAFPAWFRSRVTRQLGGLPGAAYLNYLGRMNGREGRPLRLTFADFPTDAVGAYLRRIEHPLDDREIGVELDRLQEIGTSGTLHLDPAPNGSERIGFELAPPVESRRADARAAWRSTLGRLLDIGWIGGEDVEVVEGWFGHRHRSHGAGDWPLPAADPATLLTRSVNQVKVSLEAGKAPEAKIYLAFSVGTSGPHPRIW